MKSERSVAVIGAGFGGLGAAYRLAKAGASVHIYEALPQPGGLAGGFELKGSASSKVSEPIERFYHHLFVSDTVFRSTLKQLGIENRLQFFPSSNGFWHKGKIHDLTRPIGLLGFTALSVADRVKLGLFVLRAQRRRDWEKLDKLSAKEWVSKETSSEVYKTMWEPLLRAKFGQEAETISAAWLWSKIHLRSSSRKGMGREQLGYIKGGFDSVAQSFIREIERHNGRFFWSRSVEDVHAQAGGVRLVTQGRRQNYDAVLMTIAPEVTRRIVKGFISQEDQLLAGVRHQANVCIVLTLKESISPVYWLSVGDASFPFVAVIEHTRMIPREWYGGAHIVYLSRYTDPKDEWYTASDEEVLKQVPRYLKKLFPKFSEELITSAKVSRARFTQPITPVGYGKRIVPNKTSIPGLYLASMAQIYPQDRGTNYALKQGYEVADQVLDFIKKRA